MNHCNKWLIAASIAVFACTPVRAEGFFLGLGLGGGDADFDVSVFSSGDEFAFDNESDVVVGDFFAGYEFANDVFIELSFQGYDSFGVLFLGDALDLDVVQAGVGYHFPGKSKLRFFAKGGLSFWDLEARESFVFNPGPEEVVSLDGTDFFVEGGLEYRFTDWFRLGASFNHSELDFGSVSSIRLNIKFVPQ